MSVKSKKKFIQLDTDKMSREELITQLNETKKVAKKYLYKFLDLNDKKPKIKVITICGSTKFRKEMQNWMWNTTKKGYLILYAPFAKEEIPDLEKYREILEKIHFEKIRIADEVFIFNKNGYIGDSTKSEIEFAEDIGKSIAYLEPIKKVEE